MKVYCVDCTWLNRGCPGDMDGYGGKNDTCDSPKRPKYLVNKHKEWDDPVRGHQILEERWDYDYVECHKQNKKCDCPWFTEKLAAKRWWKRLFG